MNFLPCVNSNDVDAVKSLSRDERDDLANKINQTDPHFIFTPAGDCRDSNKRKIICPVCGNGTGKDATPIEVTWENGVWLYNCFKCNDFQGDLLKIIATERNLILKDFNNYCEALAIGASLIGYPLTVNNYNTSQSKNKPISAQVPKKSEIKDDADNEKQLQFIHADISEAQAHIQDLPNDQMRGLTLHTMIHFGFGFLNQWVHPKNRLEGKSVKPSRRIIIPTKNHYNAVALPSDRITMDKKFWKMHAGNMELFNSSALNSDNDLDLILITEGEFDAASIWQASEGKLPVIAVLGAKNWNKTLLPLLNSVKNKKFLILFDADETGRTNAENLRGELVKLGFPATCRFFYDALMTRLENGDKNLFSFDVKVDANQILQSKDNYFLRTLTEDIINSAQVELEDIAAEIISQNIYKTKIDQWEEFNGAINPEFLPKIKNAAQYLQSFNSFTITAEVVQSSKTKNAIAICKFYDCFSDASDAFFVVVDKAQKLARNAIKQMKEEGDDFVAEPPKELVALSKVSVRELKRDVATLITSYKEKHKAYLQEIQFKKSREVAARRRAERTAEIKSREERLKELQTMPQTPERDIEIITLIKSLCEWKRDREGSPVLVKATAANINLIFANDPNIKNLIGYDQFQQADVLLRSPLWSEDTKRGEEWKDRDEAHLQMYLRETYTEFNNEKLIFNAITKYSDANTFHEVKDYFKNLPEWDGVPRAERLLVTFLRADDTPFTREVTLNILTAAVARIFHPGCRYQTALVIHGNQGIGKSYLIEQLGGKWYATIIDSVDDPHAVDALRNIWLGEFKEMSGMRKDINANKSFIERSEDNRRAAYERRSAKIKRHCVFFITVNDDQFLLDMTGNRRYMIVHCNSKPRDYVEGLTDEYIQQVWAEVFAHYNELFKDGFNEKKLELSRDAQIQSDKIAENYLRDDGMATEIQGYLDTKILPLILWYLLTREERRDFIKNGRLVMVDAIREFNHRRRSRGGNSNIVQRDVDTITACLSPAQTKHWLRIERKTIQGNNVDEYILYGSELRQHVCAAEIYNECFGNDKRKSTSRINEILNTLDGWHAGDRIQKIDPAYRDQKKPFYRD